MIMIKTIASCFILHLSNLVVRASPENLDTSNIIIEFDPKGVSILDIYQYRYSSGDLVPLVSLVATRFSKLFIRHSYNSFMTGTIAPSKLLGTAQYNCLDSTINKVQLFLVIKTQENCACDIIGSMVTKITKLADQANNICNKTVYTILLESTSKNCNSHLSDCGLMLNLPDRYMWGEIISFKDYCDPNNAWKTPSVPSQVVVNFLDEYEDYKSFNINLSNCSPFVEKSPPPITLMILDTMNYELSKRSFKDVVSFYETLSKTREYNFLILSAFDTYYWDNDENVLNLHSVGWWRLTEDPGTTNTSEFIFEEKIKVASKVDKEENPLYFPWYRQTPLNKKTTGIIFRNIFSNDSVGKDFCRVIILQKLDSFLSIRKATDEMMAQCGTAFELILHMKLLSKNNLNELLEIKKERVTVLLQHDFNESSLNFIQDLGFKVGYYIDLHNCPKLMHDKFTTNALSDLRASIYLFYYEEYEDTVDLGATRMFRLRSTLFDSCRKLVLKSRNKSVETGFIMKAYYKSSDFYESIPALKNYLKYIDLISSWVENMSNTVVFLSKDDEQSYEGEYGRSWDAVGWYSYNTFVEKTGYKQADGKILNDLIESTDQPNRLPFLFLSNQQFVLVICSVLILLCCLLVILIYFVYKYKKKYQLSKEESENFFKGRLSKRTSKQVDPSDIAYDEAKYEIGEDNFVQDSTKVLGSGEFGIVCCGIVMIDGKEIKVAVKSMNPNKAQKSTLKGLLSEIKILSFVGEHPNIIKLLGAHTSKIRTGQIYVFLELCHLGSLQNFLRNLHSLDPIVNFSDTLSQSEVKIAYVNTISSNRGLLDASLSNDLYRWSKEICGGMAYLAEKHVVHADLATRNILLNLRQEAKICDFGLSRRMYNYASYVKSQQGPIPWKWMAPESLRFMCFNERTDVWSFGVTLWEMYSLGSVPYAGLSWDANFVQMLEGGLVPSKPDFEERNMYKLMKDCWKIVADQRPSFSSILSILKASPADIVDRIETGGTVNSLTTFSQNY